MKYLKIENNGLIESEALFMIGASTKRNDDSKIGQFGSGNKYALAYLFRNKYEPIVFRGLEQVDLQIREHTFLNKSFGVLYVNNEKTSITVEMGKDWKLWQALRELYSNALDEGNAKIQLVDEIIPEENKTQFYILVDQHIYDFVNEFDNYFAERKIVLYENEYGKILSKNSQKLCVYRKGIRCYDENRNSMFDYDFSNIPIDEDRMVKYSWNVIEYIWKLLFSCTDKFIIKKVLINIFQGDYYEKLVSDTDSIYSHYLSKEFKETLNEISIAPISLSGLLDLEDQQKVAILPTKIFNVVRDSVNEIVINEKFRLGSKNVFYSEIEPNLKQKNTLDKAIQFLKECDFIIPYEIKLAVFDEKKHHGTTFGDCIIISNLCVESGVKWVVNTLIEEFIHIKYKVEDKTRAFQDAAINEFICYMEKKNAYTI